MDGKTDGRTDRQADIHDEFPCAIVTKNIELKYNITVNKRKL